MGRQRGRRCGSRLCAIHTPFLHAAGNLLNCPRIIHTMRRGLYFMLMVVLVLRGLTGTAMAAGVLAPLLPMGIAHQQPVALHGEAHAHGETLPAGAQFSTEHGDHHSGMQAVNADADTNAVSNDDQLAAVSVACEGSGTACAGQDHHTNGCSACEICHSAMLEAPVVLTPTQRSSGTTLPVTSAQFDSAPAALAIKPPIA